MSMLSPDTQLKIQTEVAKYPKRQTALLPSLKLAQAELGYLPPAAIAQVADPAMRALLERQNDLERQVAALRLRKDAMDPAEYDRQLEKLLTDLALKTKEIREAEAAKK